MSEPLTPHQALFELFELAKKSGAPVNQVRQYAQVVSDSFAPEARRLSPLIHSNWERELEAAARREQICAQIRRLVTGDRTRGEAIAIVAERMSVSRATVYRALADEILAVARRTACDDLLVEGDSDA